MAQHQRDEGPLAVPLEVLPPAGTEVVEVAGRLVQGSAQLFVERRARIDRLVIGGRGQRQEDNRQQGCGKRMGSHTASPFLVGRPGLGRFDARPKRIFTPAWLAGLAVAALLAAATGAPAAGRLLVTVGEVTPTTAVVWARAAGEGEVTVEWGRAGSTPASRTVRVERDADFTTKVTLTGLTPRTGYAYRVRSRGETVSGELVTAPGTNEPGPVTFLWSGDLGGGGFCRRVDRGYPIFRAMARRPADFFLFVGDTIYADRRCGVRENVPGADFIATRLEEFRAKHRYNREDAAVQDFFRRTPVYVIWDDHEVRNDFAGSTDPLMPVGRRAFLEYWPLAPPAEEPARLYRKFRWGRLLEVFILDTRQYRSPNGDPDGPGKTMLGAAQRRWLIEGVSASTAVWKVIVSSVTLSVPTGRTHRDSWSNASVFGLPQEGTGFATERDLILRRFRERGLRNLVFVTADVHHAELIRHHPAPEFSFHEFIAGPLSATQGGPRPLDAALNPRSLFARGGVNNFGEITVTAAHLTVTLIDEAGDVLFTHTIGPE
ncbi:MAG: alkaline phosphatase D family protein [Candidatus Rokubacteria bacterium]|nr:alkaline phosphatase D family protein [Candidatus Rokubacteria bacterium]